MQWSEEVGQLALALSKVQGKLEPVFKDSTAKIPTKSGSTYSYSYADLGSVIEAARDLLAEEQLAVVQMPGMTILPTGEWIGTLDTMLIHSSGQYVIGSQPLLLKSEDPQGQGSAITYARRYGLAACLGIVQTDDDAQAGQAAHKEAKPKATPKSHTLNASTPTQSQPQGDPGKPVSTAITSSSKSVTADLQDEDLIAAAEGNGWTEQAARQELAGLLDKFGQNNGRAMAAGKFSKGPVAK